MSGIAPIVRTEPKQHYTVFLCSTYADLAEERDKVLDAIRRLQLKHDSMEFFGARPNQPLETCLEEVRNSDLVVVIVGHRYGNLAPGLEISFSEAEYQEAYRCDKPCLVYLRDENAPVLLKHVERDPKKLALLDKWVNTLLTRHTIARFSEPGTLALQVATDVSRLLSAMAEPKQVGTPKVIDTMAITNESPDPDIPLDLVRFAEAFKSEDDLRKHVGSLLTKMRTQGVQLITGDGEKGADIIFYAPDGFENWLLNACIVKNSKLSDSSKFGEGFSGLVDQIALALQTPFRNSSGTNERLSRIFVISPYNWSEETMASVRRRLGDSGRHIDFLCGRRLFERFARYWPEFLLFESTLLGSYVAALQKGFEQTDPIAFLSSQHQIFAEAGTTWQKVYVRQGFRVVLQELEFLVEAPDLKTLGNKLSMEELNEFISDLQFISDFLRHPQVWEDPRESRPQKLVTLVAQFCESLKQGWSAAWDRHSEQSKTEGRVAIPKSQARLLIEPIDKDLAETSFLEIDSVLSDFGQRVEQANTFVAKMRERPLILGSQKYLNYCRVREVVRLFPSGFRKIGAGDSVHLPGDLLEKTDSPLLVTGPPGYGKTSFCKWNTLNDVQRLIEKSSSMVPVYVPLHQLATTKSQGAYDAFFRTPEIKQIVAKARVTDQKIRLYLDGLDEISSIEQQQQLMKYADELAEESFIQVIVTGRDYVSGPWLRWLSRIELAQLNETDVAQLIVNWLGDDAVAYDSFQNQLSKARTLRPLMHIPLLGTLIIAVFKKLKSLPESKVKLYQIFVDLMCGGWDLAKNVRRETRFGTHTKLGVLTRLAGILHMNGKREAQESDVQMAASQTMPAIQKHWRSLLDEVLEDGLLVRLGNQLAFSHLSFQEFLVATDLADPTGERPNQALKKYFEGDDWWREVLGFYIGMTMRPADTESWFKRGMKSANAKSDQVIQRYEFLIQCLKDTWPGWSPR